MIKGTFDAFADQFRNVGPFAYGVSENPLANIFAAIKYAQAVYGLTMMSNGSGLGSGHGYAAGTASAAPGFAWVGEHGPELLRFADGEQVAPVMASPARPYRPTAPAAPHAGDTPSLAALLTATNARLDTLIAPGAAAPGASAAALGASLNGMSRQAVTRAMYPTRVGGGR